MAMNILSFKDQKKLPKGWIDLYAAKAVKTKQNKEESSSTRISDNCDKQLALVT